VRRPRSNEEVLTVRKHVSAVVVVLALAVLTWAVPAAAEEDLLASLVEREKAMWAAWAAHDGAVFEANVVDGFVNLTPGGLSVGRAALVEDISGESCEVRSWELGEASLHQVTDDVVIVTYPVTQDATCEGNVIPAKANVASVWVQQDGEWKGAGYFEAPAAP
jgi:hypothetical protein